MVLRRPRSTRTDTLLPSSTCFRSFDLASGIPGGGLAGTLAYRGKHSASAGKIDLDGSATLDALRLFPDAAVAPAPVRFAHRTSYDLATRRGQNSNGEFSLGAAALALAGQ